MFCLFSIELHHVIFSVNDTYYLIITCNMMRSDMQIKKFYRIDLAQCLLFKLQYDMSSKNNRIIF